MKQEEMILSPCFGLVETVDVIHDAYVYEWETTFTIKKQEGSIEHVTLGISGKVVSIEVEQGDEVIPGMVLAYLEEDLAITGSD